MAVAVAVAVDKCSKSSRDALRWVIDRLVSNEADGQGQPQTAVNIKLVHVHLTSTTPLPPYGSNELEIRREPDETITDLLNPYICFCLMRQVECEPVVLQHVDVAEALKEFISFYGVQTFVLGRSERHWTARIFRGPDVPTKLENNIPSFCNVYDVHNGRVRSSNPAALPFQPFLHRVVAEETISSEHVLLVAEDRSAQTSVQVSPSVSAPISRISSTTQPDEFSIHEVDFSFLQSERPSTDSTFISFYKNLHIRGLFPESAAKNMIK